MSDGPIITEELWNRWHKTEEKKERDFSEGIETFKDDFRNSQEDFIKEAYEKIEKVKEEMVIDDIIMIYALRYEKYEDYFEYKKRMKEQIEKAKTIPVFEGNKCGFTYYVEPIILSEETFNYIIEKRGIKKNE